MTPFIIALGILGASHLSVDRDFPEEVKTGSSIVFAILGFLYLVFGVFM